MNPGAVKSLADALGVFGSALGSVTTGGLIDAGTSTETVCLVFAAYTDTTSVLIGAALARTGAHLERTRTEQMPARLLRIESTFPNMATVLGIKASAPLCGRPRSGITYTAIPSSLTYPKGARL